MFVQIRDPLAVFLIRLSSRRYLHFLRIRQQQLESRRLQNIPHRFPVDPRRFHGHVPNSFLLEPFRQFLQVSRHRPETPCLFLSLSLLADQRARRNAGFVYVQSTTTLVHNSHRILLLRHLAEDVGSVESPSRAPRPISLLPDLGQRQTIPGTTVTSRSNYITGWLSPQPLQVEYDLHAARWLASRLTQQAEPSRAPFHDSWCRETWRTTYCDNVSAKGSGKNNWAESAAMNPTGDLTNAQFPMLIRSGCRIAKRLAHMRPL